MRTILLLALALAACATPPPEGEAPPARVSGPTVSIGGGLGTFYGATR